MAAPDYVYDLLASEQYARWNGASPVGAPVTITYSFAANRPASVGYANFTPFTDVEIAAARSALSYISQLTNISFVETSADSGALKFGNGDVGSGFAGRATYNYSFSSGIYEGTVFMSNTGSGSLAASDFAPGSITSNDIGGKGWGTLLHEIGHALGLKHPFDRNIANDPESVMPAADDNLSRTVMSYTAFQPSNVAVVTDTGGGGFSYRSSNLNPDTYSIYDVAALQYLYGARATPANQTFSFSPTRPTLQTIYATGANATIDCSALTGACRIDMNDGTTSDLAITQPLPSGINLSDRYNGTSALTIAYGSKIANYLGGSGSDQVTGNIYANRISAGAGDDTIEGGAGDDEIIGGASTDTAVFRGARSEYTITLLQDGRLRVVDGTAGRDGTDMLTGVEQGRFAGVTATLQPDISQTVVANPDLVYVSRGSTADFAASLFLANDTTQGGGSLSITGVGGASNGTVALAGSQVRFTATSATAPPTGGFTYTASDGVGSAPGSVTVNLVKTTAGGDVVTVNTQVGQASFVEGGAGNDRITGGAGMDRLSGDGDNDTLFGLGGADVLLGGTGSDKLDGGTGIDRMLGGASNDTYYVDATLDVVDESRASGPNPAADAGGIDLVYATASFTLGVFVENLTLTGTGNIDGTGNGLANRINGTDAAVGNPASGRNVLSGGGGADNLYGLSGDDTLLGGAGQDRLTGGTGTDTMDGGGDGDVYYVDAADSIDDSGTSGTDIVVTRGGYILASGSGIENLTQAPGTTNASTLTGDEASNRISGSEGANYLKGLAGADFLFGGLGIDKLEGGAGRDTLNGGGNADTFIFKGNDSPATVSPAAYDTISDFVSGTDKIDLDVVGGGGLSTSQFSRVTIANNNFSTAFSAAQAQFADALHKAVYVAGTGDGWLFWTNDGNATTADAAMRISGGNTIAAVQRTDIV